MLEKVFTVLGFDEPNCYSLPDTTKNFSSSVRVLEALKVMCRPKRLCWIS